MNPRRIETLTDDLVSTLAPCGKQYYVWDNKTCGFGVRVGSSGTRSFVGKINYKDKNHAKWITLTEVSVEQARHEYATRIRSEGDAVNAWRGHESDKFRRAARGAKP